MIFAIIGDGKVAKEYKKVLDYLNIKYDIFTRSNYYSLFISSVGYNAIIVAVTWTETQNVIEDLIKFDIPVLVEKPVCLTSKRMKEVVKNNKTDHVMVAYNRRFYSFMDYLKEEFSRDLILSADVLLPEQIRQYKKQGVEQLDKHPLLYSACHYLDLLFYLTGEQEVIYSEYDSVFGSVQAMLRNGFGTVNHLQINFDSTAIPRMNFYRNKKQYIVSPIETLSVVNKVEMNRVDKILEIGAELVVSEYTGDRWLKYGFLKQMEYFIDVFIKKKDQYRKHATLYDALKVIELSEKLTKEYIE